MNPNPLLLPTLLLAAGFFEVGRRSLRRPARPAARAAFLALSAILALPGVLFAVYYLHLFDNAAWFYEFRAWPMAELAASGAGLLAGALHPLARGARRGSGALVPANLALFSLGLLVPYLKPIIAPVDLARFRDRWSGNVCLQSTPSSCGPACAATLLRAARVEATERALARECFTYAGGTESWYLARALRRRGLRVRFAVERLSPEAPPHPAIAGVRLDSGAGHFIAVLGEEGGRYEIGDPLAGRRVLSAADLGKAYRLTGFFLVAASGKEAESLPLGSPASPADAPLRTSPPAP